MSAALMFSGCTSQSTSDRLPHISELGSRAHHYHSVSELTRYSSAVVIAAPTGATSQTPFPGGGAPTPYAHFRVTKVLAGSVPAREIDVVSPGDDDLTRRSVLLSASSYVLFLTPAMYAANDPAGGFAAVGGPAGVFVRHGGTGTYASIDQDESPDLPAELTVGSTKFPATAKTAAQLLREGPH